MIKLEFKKTFATQIIVFFMIFNLLSIILLSYYMKSSNAKINEEQAKETLEEIVKEKGELISASLGRIEENAQILVLLFEEMLKIENKEDTLTDEYIIQKNDTIIRKRNPNREDAGQSCVIVPSDEKKTKELYEEINLTERLDCSFEKIVRNEDVTWAYIVTRHNVLRCCPYYDVTSAFSSDHKHVGDVFYTSANRKNNPEGKAIWTKPYVDYLGKGWTMTCTKPIYDEEGEMYGVICLDVSMNSLRKSYFEDFHMGKSGKIFLIDKDGNTIFDSTDKDSLKERGKLYGKNIFHNDTTSEEKRTAIVNGLVQKRGTYDVTEGGEKKLLSFSKIEGNDTTLFVEVDRREFINENKFNTEAVQVIITINVFLAIVFATILYNVFSMPMKDLMESVERISVGDYMHIKKSEHRRFLSIYEVKQLKKAFIKMTNSIEKSTEQLIEKNNEISTILKTVDGILMIANKDGKVILKSKDASTIEDDIIKAAIQHVIKTGTYFAEKHIIDGEMYENKYYPVENTDTRKVVISSNCITENLLLEKELQQIEKMAGVGQLSAAIVHELKNTLAIIDGAIYIIKVSDEKEQNKNEIQLIEKATKEASDIMETLLDYSKKDSQGFEMVHLGTLINQILLLSQKEIIKKNISVARNIDDDIYIYSDGREALKVILQNLIINAIQAVNQDGFIYIVCKQNERVVIKIRNDGEAIRMKPIEKIFEPFVTTKSDGTGIGLWITRRLVDKLNGTITVISEDGNTEFKIEFERK